MARDIYVVVGTYGYEPGLHILGAYTTPEAAEQHRAAEDARRAAHNDWRDRCPLDPHGRDWSAMMQEGRRPDDDPHFVAWKAEEPEHSGCDYHDVFPVTLVRELKEAHASAQRRDRGLRCGLSAVRSTLTTHVERHPDPHLQDALDSVTRMLAKVTNTALEGDGPSSVPAQFCWSADGERFEGRHASRDEALDEGREYADDGDGTVWTAEIVDPRTILDAVGVDVERIVDDIDVEIAERIGAEDRVVELEESRAATLASIVATFVREHGEWGSWFGVANVVEHAPVPRAALEAPDA